MMIIIRYFSKQITVYTKLRVHNITSKAVLRNRREIWFLNNKNSHKLEVTQMRLCLRPLMTISELDHQNNSIIREKFEV